MAEYSLADLQKKYGFEFEPREIAVLTAVQGTLGHYDSQRAYVLRIALQPIGCPGCNGIICRRSAVLNPGLFFEDVLIPTDGYQCPLCEARLSYHVGFHIGTDFFTLQPGQTVTVPDEPPTPTQN